MGLDDVVKVGVAAAAAVAGVNEGAKVKERVAELEAEGMDHDDAMKQALKEAGADLKDGAKAAMGKLTDTAEMITGKDLNGDGVVGDVEFDFKAAAEKAGGSAKDAAGVAVAAAEKLAGKDLDGDGAVGTACCTGDTIDGFVEQAKTAVGGVVEEAKTAVGGFAEEAKAAVDEAKAAVGGVVEEAKAAVGDAAEACGCCSGDHEA